MGCQVSVSIQTKQETDLTSCFGSLRPVDYNLLNFVVDISSFKNTQGIVTSAITFSTPEGPAVVNVTYDTRALRLFVTNTNNLPPGTTVVASNLAGQPGNRPALTVFITFPGTKGRTIEFQFNYFASSGTAIIASGGAVGNLFSFPSPGSIPNITASILPTPDGKEVCELTFTVTTKKQTREYKQYCVPFASVICAPGCRKGTESTLRDKILALGEGNDFLQYMVARYIISGLLNNGCFSVNALRQRYNKSFLKAVRHSQYKDFLPMLEANPKFASYFKG